jgi:hypothetical protein
MFEPEKMKDQQRNSNGLSVKIGEIGDRTRLACHYFLSRKTRSSVWETVALFPNLLSDNDLEL